MGPRRPTCAQPYPTQRAARPQSQQQLAQELARRALLRRPAALAVFACLDRASFVPPASCAAAYDDRPLALADGAVISAPSSHVILLYDYTNAILLDYYTAAPLHYYMGHDYTTALLHYYTAAGHCRYRMAQSSRPSHPTCEFATHLKQTPIHNTRSQPPFKPPFTAAIARRCHLGAVLPCANPTEHTPIHPPPHTPIHTHMYTPIQTPSRLRRSAACSRA